MRKIVYSLLLMLSVVGFVSCSEEEELQIPNENEVENRVASETKYYTSKPNSVDVYIGNCYNENCYNGKGLDLSRRTYVSIKTHESKTNDKLVITDSNGDAVDGYWLLPEMYYVPSSITVLLFSAYGTKFTVKLPDTETSEYKFDLLLYQPDTNKEYVIKDCVLIRLKGLEYVDENGDYEYSWTIIVRSPNNYSGIYS